MGASLGAGNCWRNIGHFAHGQRAAYEGNPIASEPADLHDAVDSDEPVAAPVIDGQLNITFTFRSGDPISTLFQSHATVKDAKDFISEQKHLDVNSIDLLFHGHILHDEDTLHSLHIEDNKATFLVHIKSVEQVLLTSFRDEAPAGGAADSQ